MVTRLFFWTFWLSNICLPVSVLDYCDLVNLQLFMLWRGNKKFFTLVKYVALILSRYPLIQPALRHSIIIHTLHMHTVALLKVIWST